MMKIVQSCVSLLLAAALSIAVPAPLAAAGTATPPDPESPSVEASTVPTPPPDAGADAARSKDETAGKWISLRKDGLHFFNDFSLDGVLQFWWRAYEGAQNGAIQAVSKDEAAQIGSGFGFKQVRLALNYAPSRFLIRVELGLENGVQLMDAYARLYIVREIFQVQIGQMKVPTTYEGLMPSAYLDFPTMTMFSENAPNWALSKQSSTSSPLLGIKTFGRDMGVAARGEWNHLRYMVMVGNGLGANLGIGGNEPKQYLFSNSFGAYYYAARLDVDFAKMFPGVFAPAFLHSLALGGYYSYNWHNNLTLSDKKTVLDLKRDSWDVDLRISITPYLRLAAMYGQGSNNDDFEFDGKRDYTYYGWEAKVIVAPLPDMLEAGFRIDSYRHEYNQFGASETFMNYTFGVSYRFWKHFRLDASYRMTTLESYKQKDLDDDLLLFQFQASL